MQFWYKTNQILASINKLSKDNLKLVLKEMSLYLDEEIVKEVIVNIEDSKLIQLTCKEYSSVSLYLLKICLNEYLFTANSMLCVDCSESLKEKDYIVIYII